MWTCKQVSNALAKQDYETLPWRKKLALKFHVSICLVCGRYNRQVMVIQDAVRSFRKREEYELDHPAENAPHLSDTGRDRMKAALKQDGP